MQVYVTQRWDHPRVHTTSFKTWGRKTIWRIHETIQTWKNVVIMYIQYFEYLLFNLGRHAKIMNLIRKKKGLRQRLAKFQTEQNVYFILKSYTVIGLPFQKTIFKFTVRSYLYFQQIYAISYSNSFKIIVQFCPKLFLTSNKYLKRKQKRSSLTWHHLIIIILNKLLRCYSYKSVVLICNHLFPKFSYVVFNFFLIILDFETILS